MPFNTRQKLATIPNLVLKVTGNKYVYFYPPTVPNWTRNVNTKYG